MESWERFGWVALVADLLLVLGISKGSQLERKEKGHVNNKPIL